MDEASARLGVDVGGTFTDLVLHDSRRNLVHTGKLLTTPNPSRGEDDALLEELDLRPMHHA